MCVKWIDILQVNVHIVKNRSILALFMFKVFLRLYTPYVHSTETTKTHCFRFVNGIIEFQFKYKLLINFDLVQLLKVKISRHFQ